MARELNPAFEAYAHFGNAGTCMQTLRVDIREKRTSYCSYEALVNGRWRKVVNGSVSVAGERVAIQIVRG